MSLRAAASALAAVRICERDTISSRPRGAAPPDPAPAPMSEAELALEIDCDVVDEARRLVSGVSGSAPSTPMVTADMVATTASGADTRTERGRRDGRVLLAGVSRLWR
jgi:hypothetical protein